MAAVSVTGLATGIDWDQVIEAMLTFRRQPVERMEEQQGTLQAQRSLWGEVQGSLTSLRDALQPFLTRGIGLSYAAESTEPSIATATATAGAILADYRLTVSQLATSTRVSSGYAGSGIVGVGGMIDPAQTLDTAGLGLAVTAGSFSLNGTSVAVDPTTDSMDDLIARINATVSGVTAAYDGSKDRLTLSSANPIAVGSAGDTSNFLSATGLLGSSQAFDGSTYTRQSTFHLGRMRATGPLASDNLHVTLSQTSGSFRINGTEVSYDASTQSLSSLITRINQQVESVDAYYDPTTDRVVLVNAETGASAIQVEDVSGNLMDALGLLGAGANAQANTALGQNASFTIDGFNDGNPLSSASNTVSDVIPNVTLRLIGESATAATISVRQDGDALREHVVALVNQFNATVSSIRSMLSYSAEKSKDEDEEDAAPTQPLAGNSTLFTVRSTLVGKAITPIEGLPNDMRMLAQIGIRLNNQGTLTLDETKLREQIEDDPEAVARLFFNDADSNGLVSSTEDGFAVRLDEQMDEWLSTLPTAFGGRSIPEGLVVQQSALLDARGEELDRRIAELNARIERYAEMLESRFTALEQQVSLFQANASALSSITSSMFGNLMNSRGGGTA